MDSRRHWSSTSLCVLNTNQETGRHLLRHPYITQIYLFVYKSGGGGGSRRDKPDETKELTFSTDRPLFRYQQYRMRRANYFFTEFTSVTKPHSARSAAECMVWINNITQNIIHISYRIVNVKFVKTSENFFGGKLCVFHTQLYMYFIIPPLCL